MAKSSTSIVFTGDMTSPFIRRDFEILDKYYSTDMIGIPKGRIPKLIYAAKLFFMVKKCNIFISEFASWQSALGVTYCRLFKKKSIIVVGGVDAAYIPELNYGFFCKPIPKMCAMQCYNHATKIMTIGPTLKADVIKNAKINPDRIVFLPRGHNADFYVPSGKSKEKMVITVASICGIPRYKVKGVDIFLKVAAEMRDTEFVLIGPNEEMYDYIMPLVTPNVTVIQYTTEDVIVDYFQRAKVYCQLSLREGFGNSLSEAMLCGCIGVATDIEALKFVMGGLGYLVKYGDVPAIVETIKKALGASDEMRKQARLQCLQFSTEKRIEAWKKLILEVF